MAAPSAPLAPLTRLVSLRSGAPRCGAVAKSFLGDLSPFSQVFRTRFSSRPCFRLQVGGLGVRMTANAASGGVTLSKIAATVPSTVPLDTLLSVAERCAKEGAEVVLSAVDKPRTIDYKGTTDLVTDTDRRSEDAILSVLRNSFPEHLVLGEEGGVSGDPSSEYLWCIDPLDGTTNFAHGYPCFAVCVGVLFRGKPIVGCVVEFSGGPFAWVTRTYTAASGRGAYCNGKEIHVSNTSSVTRSLLVTGFGYEHDEAWSTNMELFKHFTDVSRGVRRLGSAATDMCHVALGLVDGYWEYRLKPWDMAAAALIVEEAGGAVTRMDGGDFTVFDRSVLVSNSHLHPQLLDQTTPATQKLIDSNFDFSQWLKPKGYACDI